MSFRNVTSKSELLRQKKELEAVKEVDKILTTKKDVILQKISEVGPEVTHSLSKLLKKLDEAYEAYSILISEHSQAEVDSLAELMQGKLEVKVNKERFMDVIYSRPEVIKSVKPIPATWAQQNFYEKAEELIEALISAAWLKSFVLKLIKDLRDTDRLINALEKVVIPETEKRIAVLSLTLEERDREELNRIKKVRDKLVKRVGRV